MEDISKFSQDGYQKFRKAIFALIKSSTEKRVSENEKEWILITKRILLNEPGERQLSKPPTTEEKTIARIIKGYIEIILSYDSMTEIPLYIKRFPNRLEWKSKYLEFVIANYLNEMYILSERIEAYTKKIARIYKNTPQVAISVGEINKLDKTMKELFLKINDRRGKHVHVNRYQDDDLQRIVYLEVLYQNSKTTSDKFIASEYKKALVSYKAKWLNIIEKENKSYQYVLEMYFSIMYSIIFDKHGAFQMPK